MSKCLNLVIFILSCFHLINSEALKPFSEIQKILYCSPGKLILWNNNNVQFSHNDGKTFSKIEHESDVLDIVLFKEGVSDKVVIVTRKILLFSSNCGLKIIESKIRNSFIISFKFNKSSSDFGLALDSNNDLFVTKNFGTSWTIMTSHVYSYFW
jgi:hypothetical protein